MKFTVVCFVQSFEVSLRASDVRSYSPAWLCYMCCVYIRLSWISIPIILVFCCAADFSLPISVLTFALMAVPTRAVVLRLPNSDAEQADVPLTRNVGEWIRATRVGFRLEGGVLRRAGRLCDETLTFETIGEGNLEFVGAVAQQPAQPQQGKQSVVSLFPICIIAFRPD
jgi:hypothetical protein